MGFNPETPPAHLGPPIPFGTPSQVFPRPLILAFSPVAKCLASIVKYSRTWVRLREGTIQAQLSLVSEGHTHRTHPWPPLVLSTLSPVSRRVSSQPIIVRFPFSLSLPFPHLTRAYYSILHSLCFTSSHHHTSKPPTSRPRVSTQRTETHVRQEICTLIQTRTPPRSLLTLRHPTATTTVSENSLFLLHSNQSLILRSASYRQTQPSLAICNLQLRSTNITTTLFYIEHPPRAHTYPAGLNLIHYTYCLSSYIPPFRHFSHPRPRLFDSSLVRRRRHRYRLLKEIKGKKETHFRPEREWKFTGTDESSAPAIRTVNRQLF
nr:uncharacterized protein CTRU02_09198 [Colletotrichum truncatum]KAF6788877.1 hypothetical protein CTRU02_09198 [Colletotrichum truncatum]